MQNVMRAQTQPQTGRPAPTDNPFSSFVSQLRNRASAWGRPQGGWANTPADGSGFQDSAGVSRGSPGGGQQVSIQPYSIGSSRGNGGFFRGGTDNSGQPRNLINNNPPGMGQTIGQLYQNLQGQGQGGGGQQVQTQAPPTPPQAPTNPVQQAYNNAGMGGWYLNSSQNQHANGQTLPPALAMLASYGVPLSPALIAAVTGGMMGQANPASAFQQRGGGQLPSLQQYMLMSPDERELFRSYMTGPVGLPWENTFATIMGGTQNLRQAQRAY